MNIATIQWKVKSRFYSWRLKYASCETNDENENFNFNNFLKRMVPLSFSSYGTFYVLQIWEKSIIVPIQFQCFLLDLPDTAVRIVQYFIHPAIEFLLKFHFVISIYVYFLNLNNKLVKYASTLLCFIENLPSIEPMQEQRRK